MSHPFRDQFAVVGVGQTPTARVHAEGRSAHDLEAWAVRLAIEDAGLRLEDIDGAIHAGRPTGSDTYARKMGLRTNFYFPIGRAAFSIAGLLFATQALGTGNANYVAVSRGVNTWSEFHRKVATGSTVDFAGDKTFMTRDGGGLVDLGWTAVPGAGASHALYASRHMHEYGTTHEQLGAVALAHRAWANRNPEARFYDRKLTMEDYLQSRWVMHPLRLLDNCVVSDIGCAVIVTTAERAVSLRQRPIYVKGIGLGDAGRVAWWDKTNFVQTDAAQAKRTAFAQAGIGIADVDVAELYDCFTSEMVLQVEDYGWCKKGEGGSFIESGATAPGGSHPMNTHGGLLSALHCSDMGNIIEAVRQMRGGCGERQVDGASIAIAAGHGGETVFPYMCPVHGTAVFGNETS